ncbi:MAG: heparinase II/III family protein [Pseudomonadales bacterium]
MRLPFRLAPPLAAATSRLDDGAFRFLNVTGPSQGSIDWNPEGHSRLWRYNLHYFDYLRQPDLGADAAAELIRSWIADNPQAAEPGWEPFPTSLRIVNWIFASRAFPEAVGPHALTSLYLQARWLYRNDERHILANHYFENLKALAFAGAFFRGAEPRRWLRRAVARLRAQLVEQTLPDGGHYERSPQYHGLMLENYLDLINLSDNNPDLFESCFVAELRAAAGRGLDWLNDIVFPDGRIPLFNDSAFGIAPTAAELSAYARRLFGYCYAGRACEPELICKDDSGLYGVRAGGDMVLMDCGAIGPDYQPGHTHCDFLSYELMLDGRRVVVDTGVFEYAPGPMRDYVRSTRAHNTVVIDDDEQSELWGEFRVGRRAEKIYGNALRDGDRAILSGKYRGFFGGTWRLQPRFTVARKVVVELSGARIAAMEVSDVVEGDGHHRLESFAHLHPELSAAGDGARSVRITDRDGRLIGTLTVARGCTYTIRTTSHHPEFGIHLANQCVVVSKRSTLPTGISYRFSPGERS